MTDQRIDTLLRVALDLRLIADEGEVEAIDDSARALFCEVRDCAYRIRARAEHERERRRLQGSWDRDGADGGRFSI